MTFAPPTAPVTPNRTLRTVLLVGGSLALVVVLAITALGAAHTASAAGGEERTRVLPGEVTSVEIDASVADVDVRVADVDEPTVEWQPGGTGLRLRSQLENGALSARVQGQHGWGPFGWFIDAPDGQASLTVLLPQRAAGADLAVDATAGRIDLQGDWGAVELAATVGDVRLAGTAASLDLQVTAANVLGEGLEVGSLVLDATAGDIDLAFAELPASIDASSTAGDLRIALPEGEYELRTENVVGGVVNDLISTPGADRVYRFESTAGDIALAPLG